MITKDSEELNILERIASPEHEIQKLLKTYTENMVLYSSAIKKVITKLEILNDEFQAKNKRNPIEYMKSRVKKPKSILEKLQRYGLPLTMDSIKNDLHDIAGIRVVCSFIDDIYMIAGLLKAQDDVTLLSVKDYIKNPKENGYRSLHLVIMVPVFFSDCTEHVRVEIQIRTIAMDFWASLEHNLRYKVSIDVPEEISTQLKECATVIAATDKKMQDIHYALEEL